MYWICFLTSNFTLVKQVLVLPGISDHDTLLSEILTKPTETRQVSRATFYAPTFRGGHIELSLSVRPSVRLSVRPSDLFFCVAHNSKSIIARVMKLYKLIDRHVNLCTSIFSCSSFRRRRSYSPFSANNETRVKIQDTRNFILCRV